MSDDITPEQAQEIWEQHKRIWKPRLDAEEEAVRRLGDQIGYGRLMQAAETVWRAKAIAQNTPGSEYVVGCCGAFMVPCPHRDNDAPERYFDENGHCDWCCGSGRVTKRVAQAMREST